MLGQGDLVGRLAMGITRDIAWVIGVVSILTESPDPPSIQDLMCIFIKHSIVYVSFVNGSVRPILAAGLHSTEREED